MFDLITCFTCFVLGFISFYLASAYLQPKTTTFHETKSCKTRRTYGHREPWMGFTPETKASVKLRRNTQHAEPRASARPSARPARSFSASKAPKSPPKSTSSRRPSGSKSVAPRATNPPSPAPATKQPDVLQAFRQFMFKTRPPACMAKLILAKHETPPKKKSIKAKRGVRKVESTLRLRRRKPTCCTHRTQAEVTYAYRAEQVLLMKRDLVLSDKIAALKEKFDAKCEECSILETTLGEQQLRLTEYAEERGPEMRIIVFSYSGGLENEDLRAVEGSGLIEQDAIEDRRLICHWPGTEY